MRKHHNKITKFPVLQITNKNGDRIVRSLVPGAKRIDGGTVRASTPGANRKQPDRQPISTGFEVDDDNRVVIRSGSAFCIVKDAVTGPVTVLRSTPFPPTAAINKHPFQDWENAE